MEIFKNDDDGYLKWKSSHIDGFVFNRFGGTNSQYNVLHRSTCSYLAREKDEDARTVVEKWCSPSEVELAQHANAVLGDAIWKRCARCFQRSEPSQNSFEFAVEPASEPVVAEAPVWIPGEAAVWIGAGEKEWKQKATAIFRERVLDDMPQWIDFDFRLPSDKLYRKDIDNILTPLLESARDAGWIQPAFQYLGAVTSRKSAASTPEEIGVLVTRKTGPPQLEKRGAGVLIETELTGLDENTVKYGLYEKAYELYQQHPELRFLPQTPLAMDIRVVVNDAGRRKSIHALLKPCIDGTEPILGHPKNQPPEPPHLRPAFQPQDEMVRSLTFNVRGGPTTSVSVLICPY
ncbi:MAG: hypothetical protein KDA65_10195 [Planctomycetaceae bacterium]|nr:hypothetical protein [Planctomycetaceae bacterium]